MMVVDWFSNRKITMVRYQRSKKKHFLFKKRNKNSFKNIQFKLCVKYSLNVETKERCDLFMVALDVIGSST